MLKPLTARTGRNPHHEALPGGGDKAIAAATVKGKEDSGCVVCGGC